MNIFYIIAFLVGTGFGWCLCSLVDYIHKYLEMKRYRRKSEETWASLRPYLEHRRIQVGDTVEWIRNNEVMRREHHGIQQHEQKSGGEVSEDSSAS